MADSLLKSIKTLRSIVLDVGSLVVTRFPHVGTITIRHGIDDPTGQVLGRGIEVQHLVDVGMVDLAMNQALDLGEVAHHAVAVELLATAIHVDLPVVAMEVLALALVVEVKLVAGGDLKGFSDVVHGISRFQDFKIHIRWCR